MEEARPRCLRTVDAPGMRTGREDHINKERMRQEEEAQGEAHQHSLASGIPDHDKNCHLTCISLPDLQKNMYICNALSWGFLLSAFCSKNPYETHL